MQKYTRLFTIVFVSLLLIPVSICPVSAGDRISVFVSIIPQAYFVERIGGDLVEVEVLVGPGQSPATYEPKPKQLTKLAGSRLYFRIGVPFETALLKKLSRSFVDLTIVDTRENVKLRYFSTDHEHQSPDPHIWLDPKRVKIQATTICAALKHVDPVHVHEYAQNLETFHVDLDRIDSAIGTLLAPHRGQTLYVYHPTYGYFAEAYGLDQHAIQVEGKEPGAKQLAELIAAATREGVQHIFVQPQFSRKNADALARAIGATVVILDPLAPDYLANLWEIAQRIDRAFSASTRNN
jgi:zinc transport system substrate-binding protein